MAQVTCCSSELNTWSQKLWIPKAAPMTFKSLINHQLRTVAKLYSNKNYHAKLTLGNSQLRAIIYGWVHTEGVVSHLAALEGEIPGPPLHGAHLLIIRIPKATTEIRRGKGINAYGAEHAAACNAITHYKSPRVADGYVGRKVRPTQYLSQVVEIICNAVLSKERAKFGAAIKTAWFAEVTILKFPIGHP